MTPAIERTVWLARHVTPHEPALRAWLRRQVGPGVEVDDVVQDTYAALVGLAGVDHIASPRAYAFHTAQALVRLQYRRARAARFEALENPSLDGAAEDAPSPEQVVAARQELRRLESVIEALPPRRREAFILHKIEGLTQRDVARRMGISEGVVEVHIGRALQALTSALDRPAGLRRAA